MSKFFDYSPLKRRVQHDDDEFDLFYLEYRELIRGFCAALFLAVPLHFTLEMWQLARTVSSATFLLIIVLTYVINVGFNMFTGYKGPLKRRAVFFDALSAMGIGFMAAAITMLLIDQVSYQMSFENVMKVTTLEMVPTSFGASLTKSQLGSSSERKAKDMLDLASSDIRKLVGALLGAIIFSFNVAATVEPQLISCSINNIQLLGLVLFSLLVSYMMVFVANFVERDQQSTGLLSSAWSETMVTYILSLGVSAGLLLLFGYIDFTTSISTSLPLIVVLGYATSLGSSAGRLII